MGFPDFIKKNRIPAILFSALTALVYIPLVCSKYYCADLEYIVDSEGTIYNWSELGRYTLLLLKKITFTPYNLYVESILFVITAFALTIALAYLLFCLDEKIKPVFAFFLASVALIFPTFAEQYYFKFQSFEVIFGILLLIVSFILLVHFLKTKSIISVILSVVLTVLSFGVYQSMLNIAVTSYIGIFLILLLKKDSRDAFRCIPLFTIHFILSFALNKVVALIFCKEGSYFADKIMWKQFPFSTCFHFVKHYIRVVLFAEKYVYTYSFLIAILFSLIALIILLINNKKDSLPSVNMAFIMISFAVLLISPFIIAIIQGFEPDSRTQLALPFTIMFQILFADRVFANSSLIKRKKTDDKAEYTETEITEDKRNIRIRILMIAILSVILLNNLIPTGRLIYSRMLINRSDEKNMIAIGEDLKDFNCSLDNPASVPVIIIGTLPTESNVICYRYNEENKDYILLSVFDLDAETEPEYFFSTNRIVSAMNITAYRYNRPSLSNFMNDAYAEAAGMPAYPNAGYIKETDNFVVVNLGNY